MTEHQEHAGRKAAVVGAGRMGHGIALELARGGFQVSIYDSAPGRADEAIAEARRDAADLVSAGVLQADEVDAVIARLEPCAKLAQAAQGAEFVNEAVAEDLDVKRQVFTDLDRICPPPAILASNTSSISVSAIAESCAQPQRVVLAHWMLPPHLLPVVEVAPGRQTDEATLTATRELLESLGKWPILMNRDIPGYLLNRLQFALVREALHLVAEGVATPAELDRLVRGSLARRMPVLGIFRQADMAGLELYEQIFTYLGADLNARPDSPPVLAATVAQGHTGAREGRGFYSWKPGELEAGIQRRNAWLIQMLRDDRAGSST